MTMKKRTKITPVSYILALSVKITQADYTGRKPRSQSPLFIDDSDDDSLIEELVDCTVPEYVPKPGSKRDLQNRGLAPKRVRRSESDINPKQPKATKTTHRSHQSPTPPPAIKSNKATTQDLSVGVSFPKITSRDRQDSLEPLPPRSNGSLASGSLSKPQEAVPTKHVDDWAVDEDDFSAFIIESSPPPVPAPQVKDHQPLPTPDHPTDDYPVDYYPIDGYQPIQHDHQYAQYAQQAIYQDQQPLYHEQQYDLPQAPARFQKPQKGRVRFASRDDVQEHQDTQVQMGGGYEEENEMEASGNYQQSQEQYQDGGGQYEGGQASQGDYYEESQSKLPHLFR